MSAREKWEEKIKARLVGRKIVDARYLTQAEMEDMGWDHAGLAMFLDDGTDLVLMQDDEGNGPGACSTSLKDLPIIPVMR